MVTPKFALDEIVFAKLKGWPPWPAKVEFFENIPSSNKVKYNVYFYGTNQIAQCREEDLFPYIEYKNKFGKPKKATGFMKAISQADSELQRHDRSLNTTVGSDSNLSNLDYLKAELQVLKIDKGLKVSLNLSKPHFGSCLNLLDEYSETNLTPLMFKKNPHLIDTLIKLQVYSRNVNFENSPDYEQFKGSDECEMYLIRQKASNIYHRVQSIFTIPQGKLFLEAFAEILNEFNKSVKNMTENELLQLSRDPTSLHLKLDESVNKVNLMEYFLFTS